MIKVKHKNKTYEYDTIAIIIDTETKGKIKEYAKKEDLTIKAFIRKLVKDYEN